MCQFCIGLRNTTCVLSWSFKNTMYFLQLIYFTLYSTKQIKPHEHYLLSTNGRVKRSQSPNYPKIKKKNHSTTIKIYNHHWIYPLQPPTPTSVHPKKKITGPPPTVVHSKILCPYNILTPTPLPEKIDGCGSRPVIISPFSHERRVASNKY